MAKKCRQNQKYEKKIKDYIDAKSRDNVEKFLQILIEEGQKSIFKNILDINILNLLNDYGNKKMLYGLINILVVTYIIVIFLNIQKV